MQHEIFTIKIYIFIYFLQNSATEIWETCIRCCRCRLVLTTSYSENSILSTTSPSIRFVHKIQNFSLYISYTWNIRCCKCQIYKLFLLFLWWFLMEGLQILLIHYIYIYCCLRLLLKQLLFVFSLSFVQHKLDSSHGFLTLNTHTSHQHTTETPQSSTVTHLLQTALVCPDLLW